MSTPTAQGRDDTTRRWCNDEDEEPNPNAETMRALLVSEEGVLFHCEDEDDEQGMAVSVAVAMAAMVKLANAAPHNKGFSRKYLKLIK